jgi:hypothetical protein
MAESSLPESESCSPNTGKNSSSAPSPAASVPSRARPRMRFSLPHRALISPLWHSERNGWARSHVGSVLVENRWWKMAQAAA